MTIACTVCGDALPDGARFCPGCGAPAAVGAPVAEERKLVTILFADLTGSTAIGERLDPERLRMILGQYFEALSGVIASWGGTVEKFIGDAIMAVFGVPAVREDDAPRALSAALEMLERLDALNDGFRERHGVVLAVRIGVNSGEVIAPVGGPAQQLIVAGDPVNVAARLQAAAEPGTILVGERTWLATRDAFRFEEPRSLTVAGKAEQVVARRLVERAGEPARGIPGLRSPMVGRDRELATLVSLLEETIERGEPRLAVVYGPAGIGKSRLIGELVGHADERHAARALRGRCLAAGHGITYWALAEILRSACAIGLDEPADVVRDRLEQAVGDLLADPDSPGVTVETIAALAATAGIDLGEDDALADREPRAMAEAIGRAWPRFLSAIARRGPLVVVVEDLHWAGDQLTETLTRIATRTEGPVLVVASARPEFAERGAALGSGASATAISLQPLTPGQAAAVVDGLLAVTDLPPDQRSTIVERAEGNPFFLEEIVRRLIDEGAIVHDAGRWRATDAIRTMVIPDTVHALLAARIDALPPDERAVLREAAVVGRVFWPAPIRSALPSVDVDDALRSLEVRGLIMARPTTTIGGEAEHAFRHSLVRDVAYEALPRVRRARAHAAIAEWTEQLAGERGEEFAELVANHYRLAVAGEGADLAWADDPSRLAALRASAFGWLLRAGTSARRRYALDHAVSLHEQAVTVAAAAADRCTALEALGDDHAAAYHGDEAVSSYLAALDEVGSVPPEGAHARLLMKASREAAQKSGTFRDHVPPPTVDRWVADGLAADPDDLTRAWLLAIRADTGVAWSSMMGYDPVLLEDRVTSATEAVELAQRLGATGLESAVLGSLAQLHERAGRWDDVLADIREALALADRLEGSNRLEALVFGADRLAALTGRHDEAEALLASAATLARDLSTHERLHVSGTRIEILARCGRWDEALGVLDRHLAEFHRERDVSCGMVRMGPVIGAMMQAHRGQADDARRLLALVPPIEARINASIEGMRARSLVALGEAAEAYEVCERMLANEAMLSRPIVHVARLEAIEAAGLWDAVPGAANDAAPSLPGDVSLPSILDRLAGTAAAAHGDPAAATLLRRAIDRADRYELLFEGARAREALGRHSGETAEGVRLLVEALKGYESLGAAPHAARLRDRLTAYDSRAASS